MTEDEDRITAYIGMPPPWFFLSAIKFPYYFPFIFEYIKGSQIDLVWVLAYISQSVQLCLYSLVLKPFEDQINLWYENMYKFVLKGETLEPLKWRQINGWHDNFIHYYDIWTDLCSNNWANKLQALEQSTISWDWNKLRRWDWLIALTIICQIDQGIVLSRESINSGMDYWNGIFLVFTYFWVV